MELIRPSAKIVDTEGMSLEQVIERAGRCCYKSECNITDESAVPFCRMLVERGHESVLEHANIPLIVDERMYACLTSWPYAGKSHADGGPYPTHRPMLRCTKHGDRHMVSGNVRAWRDALRMSGYLYDVECVLFRSWPTLFGDLLSGRPAPVIPRGVAYVPNEHLVPGQQLTADEGLTHRTVMAKFVIDRGVSHELVRHRHDVGFSQESTRYCDYGGEVTFIIPSWLPEVPEGTPMGHTFTSNLGAQRWLLAMRSLEDDYRRLRGLGWKPEQARAVLPNSLKTEVIVTATLREWCHIFRMRCAEAAHPQMREVMLPLREEFRNAYQIA